MGKCCPSSNITVGNPRFMFSKYCKNVTSQQTCYDLFGYIAYKSKSRVDASQANLLKMSRHAAPSAFSALGV